MKLFKKSGILISLVMLFFLVGCMTNQCKDMPAEKYLSHSGNGYTKKIDTLFIIEDTSSSMQSCSGSYSCFNLSHHILKNIVSGLPDGIDIKSAYLTFGHAPEISEDPTLVPYNLSPFSKQEFLTSIDGISKAGGTSRLDLCLENLSGMLKGTSGNSAVFIVSDGLDMGEAPFAIVEKIRAEKGSDVCIYTIQTGLSELGQRDLSALAATAGCGQSFNAGALTDNASVQKLLEDTVLGKAGDYDNDGVPDYKDYCAKTPAGIKVDKKGCPFDADKDGVYDYMDACPKTPVEVKVDSDGCPLDSDKDGVPDYKDKCPGTKEGVKVGEYGCTAPVTSEKVVHTKAGTWIYNDIQFTSGKVDINKASAKVLNDVAALLKESKHINLEVQGHTDNRGNKAYNYKLSQQRADSVKAYLIEKGIAPERLTSKGYGPSKPMAANDTIEGRKTNRRVEFKPVTE